MESREDAIQETLANEILRKLHLATEAEQKEDREIICSEVFTDITGSLDEIAQEQLRVERKCKFYEVLAPFFLKRKASSEALLLVCRKLWGQPYVAPIYALLLYQWMLLEEDAGGADQRQKHVNVLLSGAQQLFWGDIHSDAAHFQPLHDFLSQRIVFGPARPCLEALPGPSRVALLAVVASFLPFYPHPEGVDLSAALEGFPSPEHTLESGPHVPGEGADFVLGEVTAMLQKMRSERSLAKYLKELASLKGSPYLGMTRLSTRVRLQAELYRLTVAGGPRYVPRSINRAAFATLDALFPLGQSSRRVISFAFRVPHAVAGIARSAAAALRAWLRASTRLLAAIGRLPARTLHAARGWREYGAHPD